MGHSVCKLVRSYATHPSTRLESPLGISKAFQPTAAAPHLQILMFGNSPCCLQCLPCGQSLSLWQRPSRCSMEVAMLTPTRSDVNVNRYVDRRMAQNFVQDLSGGWGLCLLLFIGNERED